MRCPEDMQIYSFAKYFPIQLGGLLVAGSSYRLPKNRIDSATEQYIKSVLSYYQQDIDKIAEIRRLNHKKLAGRLSKLGLAPRLLLRILF